MVFMRERKPVLKLCLEVYSFRLLKVRFLKELYGDDYKTSPKVRSMPKSSMLRDVSPKMEFNCFPRFIFAILCVVRM